VYVRKNARGVCVVARGRVCDNVWPVLFVRIGDKIVGRRYVRADVFQVYDLPVELERGRHRVAVGFENDAADSLTGRDPPISKSAKCASTDRRPPRSVPLPHAGIFF